MKWTPGGPSPDIEDDRDSSGGGGFQFGGIHLGIGGTILVLILSFVFRTNLFALLGGGVADTGPAVSQPDPARDEQEKPLVQFVSFVLDDVQNTWTQVLPHRPARRTTMPSSCFFAMRSIPDAETHNPRQVLFIAPRMKKSTSTLASSTNSARGSARRGSSRKRTCWPTRSGITCRSY